MTNITAKPIKMSNVSRMNAGMYNKSVRTVITPKSTQVGFNMIGGVSTLHIHVKNGSVVGTLVCRDGKFELNPKVKTTPRLIEACLIKQAYDMLVERSLAKKNELKVRRNSDDKDRNKPSYNPNPNTSPVIEDLGKLNVKGAEKIKSIDPNWINDIKIIEIINNKNIKIL
jgi:hypothetical protein